MPTTVKSFLLGIPELDVCVVLAFEAELCAHLRPRRQNCCRIEPINPAMNPNAKEFSFNPAAAAFTPPTPAAAAPSSTTIAKEEEVDGGEDAIDENDPLWKATLVIAGGDRAKAVKLLEDPDALMQ